MHTPGRTEDWTWVGTVVQVCEAGPDVTPMTQRPRKTGRPRIEDRAYTIEARKPWLKLGMSRRTWYRRQAERRAGQE